MYYKAITTKCVGTVLHHTVDPLYSFCPPCIPSPLITANLCFYEFVFVFVLRFFIRVKSYGICFSPSD